MAPDDMSEPEVAQPDERIWNPNATALWSIVLTPVFGAYLQALNWERLNEPARAQKSKYWTYAGIGLVTVLLEIRIWDPERDAFRLRCFIFYFLLLWYFTSALSQVKFVLRRFGNDYPRRRWAIALAGGFASMILYPAAVIYLTYIGAYAIRSLAEYF